MDLYCVKMAILRLIFLFAISSTNAVSLEPMSSKFSYDEQLLEKMVRMEFFVENMQKNVTTIAAESKIEMSDMKLAMSQHLTATIEDVGVKFETFKANVTSSVESTETTVRGMIEEVQEKVEDFITNVTERHDALLTKMSKDFKSHENKFEDFKASISDSNAKVVKGLNEEMRNIEKKFEDFKTSISDSNTKAVKEVKEGMENTEKKFENFKKSIDDTILKTMGELMDKKYPAVAFNVYGTDKTYSGSTIPFKKIRLNEGNGFSLDTSKFSAPVTGLYQFNAHICVAKGKTIDYYIQAGDVKLARGEYRVPNAAGDGKCTSFSGVALLRESQTAYVGGVLSSEVFVNNDDINSFSGILIRAT